MKKYYIYQLLLVLTLLLILSLTNMLYSQEEKEEEKKSKLSDFVSVLHGMSFETGYHGSAYGELGYSFLFDTYYYRNKKHIIKSKQLLLILDQKIGYNALNAMSLKSSFRCSFETRNWEFHPNIFNFGVDYTYLNNFAGKSGSIFTPKISFTVFYGCIELNYGYNFIPNKTNAFDFKNHSVGLVLRPYIFIKPMSKMWG